ncbi:MAG: serine/threonine-protein phosphatase, partial [Actinomycetota bacterium]|nr:serine/threonine-protein phosphatase [Actinomycetota bacterium]
MTLRTAVGELILAMDRAFPTSLTEEVTACLQRHTEASEAEILLTDYDVLALRRLDDGVGDPPPAVPLDATHAGRAFLAQAPVLETTGTGTLVHVPISLRAERIGVLCVHLPAAPETDVLLGLEQIATALAYVLRTAWLYTDLVERVRRVRPLELPAEMQWSQQPVRAFESSPYYVAGQILPAYEVGGDLFDYAVGHDRLSVFVIDAMGHGLGASMLSTLAIAALRNARRTGLDLVDQVRLADNVLWRQYGGDQFVTLFALELRHDGVGRFVSAGHPSAVLVRDGRPGPLDLAPQLPLGMFERSEYAEQRVELEPGDRLVLATDGVTEARSVSGDVFGDARLEGALMATLTAVPGEVTRQVMRILQDFQSDEPRDDATLVCLDWRGTEGADAELVRRHRRK